MSRASRQRSVKRPGCLGLAVVLGILMFLSGILTVTMAFAIWPGEMKLTASLFCDEDKPDAYVVSDTYSSQPGETSTSFTLYCMGPRGQVTDEGLGGPFLVLWAAHTVLLGLAAGLLLWRSARRYVRTHEPELSQPG